MRGATLGCKTEDYAQTAHWQTIAMQNAQVSSVELRRIPTQKVPILRLASNICEYIAKLQENVPSHRVTTQQSPKISKRTKHQDPTATPTIAQSLLFATLEKCGKT